VTDAQIEIHIGVIEWDSDDGHEPLVLADRDADSARRRIAAELWSAAERDPQHDQLPEFLEDHGNPADLSDDEVATWLDDHREATTVPWATFYKELV
jgi:hypothetical protein